MTRWQRLGVLLLLALLCASTARAQTVTVTITAASKIGGDQAAPTLAVAQAYVYRIYLDAGTTGTILAMTCAGTATPFQCFAPFPAVTPALHTATITTAMAGGPESPKSTAVSFTTVVLAPSPLVNLRVQ